MSLFKRIKNAFFPARPILLDDYRIVPAFNWKGIQYFMHEDPVNTSTGRGLHGMIFMEEILMRCSADYLKLHVEAMEKILHDREKIDLTKIMVLNNNLKQRLNLLIALPEHVFKLASIVYFTADESPAKYDRKINEKKIAQWQEDDQLYDFFCTGHLKTLVPWLTTPENDSSTFFKVVNQVSKVHLNDLHEVLSKAATMHERKN